jgi:hypothetical protein
VRRWTAWVRWPDGGTEEIDTTAATRTEAMANVRRVLADGYQPGGTVVQLEDRPSPWLYN